VIYTHSKWFTSFLGLAYRYFDVKMNVVILLSNLNDGKSIWNEIINPWQNNSIKIRFVERQNQYLFIMYGYDNFNNTTTFYKILPRSSNYDRFKLNCNNEAYVRLGIYTQKYQSESKFDDVCNCSHTLKTHDYNNGTCRSFSCICKKFITFQIVLLKKKKTITNIKFLKTHDDIKNDPVVWNCFYVNNLDLN